MGSPPLSCTCNPEPRFPHLHNGNDTIYSTCPEQGAIPKAILGAPSSAQCLGHARLPAEPRSIGLRSHPRIPGAGRSGHLGQGAVLLLLNEDAERKPPPPRGSEWRLPHRPEAAEDVGSAGRRLRLVTMTKNPELWESSSPTASQLPGAVCKQGPPPEEEEEEDGSPGRGPRAAAEPGGGMLAVPGGWQGGQEPGLWFPRNAWLPLPGRRLCTPLPAPRGMECDALQGISLLHEAGRRCQARAR